MERESTLRRRVKVIEILRTYDITTQAQLVAYLREAGVAAQQSIVSGDLKAVKAQRDCASGRYYVA